METEHRAIAFDIDVKIWDRFKSALGFTDDSNGTADASAVEAVKRLVALQTKNLVLEALQRKRAEQVKQELATEDAVLRQELGLG